MDKRDIQSGASASDFWFRAKRRLIDRMLARYAKGSDLRIVNIGAGVGDDLPVISRYGSVYASDVDAESVALMDGRHCAEKTVADACALPYPDGFFDLAVAFDVLEHIGNDQKAVAELRRVLKPGGLFLFSVPAGPSLYGAHDRALGHCRRYTADMVRRLFAGWRPEYLNRWNTVLFFPAALKRLLDKGKEAEVQSPKLPPLLNALFYRILAVEAWMVQKGVPLPAGLSLVGVVRKD